ncbi:MAG: helix-turn-helix domain-containing protein [Verrucomicrobiota bacterium]
MEISSQLARATAFHIGQDFLADRSLSDLAAQLGITDRQMRRVFQEEFGVSPIEFWQTQRLLLAKQLLTDSSMPVTSVALASGFRSVRRFNTLLKARLSHDTNGPAQGAATGKRRRAFPTSLSVSAIARLWIGTACSLFWHSAPSRMSNP